MYPATLCVTQCFGSNINVIFLGSCQRTYYRLFHRLRYFYYRKEIARARDREASLDNINAEKFQLTCYNLFLIGRQLATWNLLTITQGCIEDLNFMAHIFNALILV